MEGGPEMSFPIELLRCPISGQTMKSAPGDVVHELQRLQVANTLRNHGAQLVVAFDGGLLTADGTWFYPMRSGIPVMLAAEAVAVVTGRREGS
jgi:uncharacterized protein YbaR (Trm112 family)